MFFNMLLKSMKKIQPGASAFGSGHGPQDPGIEFCLIHLRVCFSISLYLSSRWCLFPLPNEYSFKMGILFKKKENPASHRCITFSNDYGYSYLILHQNWKNDCFSSGLVKSVRIPVNFSFSVTVKSVGLSSALSGTLSRPEFVALARGHLGKIGC